MSWLEAGCVRESEPRVAIGGFVLAGGRSRRMGQDKALLLFEGAPLIARAVAKVRDIASEVSILGNRPDLALYAHVVEDRHQACGPLGGIEAGLASSQHDLNLFFPVDTPFVPAPFLAWMCRRAIRSGAAATIPRLGGDPQPLIAIYSKRLIPGLTDAIQAGRLKTIDAVLASSQSSGGADLFRVEMTAPFLPGPGKVDGELNVTRCFENLNTPSEIQGAELSLRTVSSFRGSMA